MNMGIDPEILAIGTEMAVYHIEKGARKFAEYATAMIADLGDAIRPYLKAFYNGTRELPKVVDAGFAEEMTPFDEVNAFDVINFDKTGINALIADNSNGKLNYGMKTIKDAVYDAFMIQGVNYPEMSIEDVVLEIQDKDSDFKGYDLNELYKKVSSYLSNAVAKTVKGKRVENKDSLYQRVKNDKGGYKKGIYKLRKPKPSKAPKTPKPILAPVETPMSVESLYMGSAGEMAVCSELLFREYNVSRMSVDDGIDIVAMKNNKTYYIQVKTVQIKSESFSIQIKTKSYERYNANDCYYIIVARGETTKFIIATADDIRRLIERGSSKGEKYISLRFTQNMGCLFVGEENVNYMLNSFERIK